MGVNNILEKNKPFGALIAASSLIVALLYVAGFTYRWAYYYNFGVQHLVFKLNFQSFLITAIELIREPNNLLLSLIFIVIPFILLNHILGLISRAADTESDSLPKRLANLFATIFGLRNILVVDSIRALVLLYMVFMLSSEVGYRAFKRDVINSPNNALPSVTAIVHDEDSKNAIPLICGAENENPPHLIGDAKKIRLIQKAFRTCNSLTREWRLIYRDNESIYLFASESPEIIKGRRPLTIILPNTPDTYLVME